MARDLLSRIAETLYWIGRYVERADDIARILDVSLRRALAGEDDATAVFAILGHPLPGPDAGPPTAATMVRRLAYDPADPGSIAGCLRAARENARGVREIISTEVWECLNVTWNALPETRAAAERLGPHVYLRYVRERAALLAGLADATMSRDDGWRFLVLGRSLERADMTSRLIAVQTGLLADPAAWRMLLEACGADESFTRTHRGDSTKVLEFLLLDRLFPRSVVHALATAERCLAELAPNQGRAGTADAARAAIGRVRMTLEYADTAALPARLPRLLDEIREAGAAAMLAIGDRFFPGAAPAGWVRGGSSWAGA
ncbi:alpha-E domain-containing protein [Microbispora sp. H10670]|uniref:alpha-E domain-containing protein n=1 Tax=Microbispora sp. H10670 TaxID=2729108 RepID=UPI001603B2A5|nr:alpha-E domain-containing protein [Microbispora sp. H10670]